MKKIIVIGVVGVVVLAVVGGGGFFGYMLQTELSEYKKVGSLASMQTFSQENFDLKKQNKELTRSMNKIQKGFAEYRKQEVANAEFRAERRVATSVASFMPLSGPYVLAAVSSKEQLELCEDTQRLIRIEAELFESSDPAVVMQQEKICGTYLDRKLIPLFKYQMLRVRATMSGSLGHLRADADKKFENARALLSKWEVPIQNELDNYTRFK
jgi:hypothetical protein